MSEPQIEIKTREHTVRAMLGDEEVGHITVPHIDFNFCEGLTVPLAGIQAVRTDSNYRRRGIARAMMQEVNEFALTNDYCCSAVSTGYSNIARRLYSSSGHVHLFSQPTWEAPLDEITAPAASNDVHVQSYSDADEQAVVDLIAKVQGPYFGTRVRSPERHRKLYSGWKDDSPPAVAAVARRDGKVVGYAHRLHYWSGLESEVFALDDSVEVLAALLASLVERLKASDDTALRVAVSDCQRALQHLLYEAGLRPQKEYVFMCNVLNWQGFLDTLAPLFEKRVKAIDISAVPEAVTIEAGDRQGIIHLNGPAGPFTIRSGSKTLTRVICGLVAGWDAYLVSDMDIEPKPTVQVASAIQAIFPSVPYQHPPLDRW
ncbi:MAG: GNAT family N-acetyltransferase [Armatimonadota bacterium]